MKSVTRLFQLEKQQYFTLICVYYNIHRSFLINSKWYFNPRLKKNLLSKMYQSPKSNISANLKILKTHSTCWQNQLNIVSYRRGHRAALDDDDDLFAGLGDGPSKPRGASAASKPSGASTDFMSSLFGGSGSANSNKVTSNTGRGGSAGLSGGSGPASREFVLDDKFKQDGAGTATSNLGAPSSSLLGGSSGPAPRSRRGTPFVTPQGALIRRFCKVIIFKIQRYRSRQ